MCVPILEDTIWHYIECQVKSCILEIEKTIICWASLNALSKDGVFFVNEHFVLFHSAQDCGSQDQKRQYCAKNGLKVLPAIGCEMDWLSEHVKPLEQAFNSPNNFH